MINDIAYSNTLLIRGRLSEIRVHFAANSILPERELKPASRQSSDEISQSKTIAQLLKSMSNKSEISEPSDNSLKYSNTGKSVMIEKYVIPIHTKHSEKNEYSLLNWRSKIIIKRTPIQLKMSFTMFMSINQRCF